MTSRDFGFITLRNAVAYRPDNSIVPINNVYITSTNGAAIFSDTLTISTINVSTINGGGGGGGIQSINGDIGPAIFLGGSASGISVSSPSPNVFQINKTNGVNSINGLTSSAITLTGSGSVVITTSAPDIINIAGSGGGSVNSVSSGINISTSGTASDPIINVYINSTLLMNGYPIYDYSTITIAAGSIINLSTLSTSIVLDEASQKITVTADGSGSIINLNTLSTSIVLDQIGTGITITSGNTTTINGLTGKDDGILRVNGYVALYGSSTQLQINDANGINKGVLSYSYTDDDLHLVSNTLLDLTGNQGVALTSQTGQRIRFNTVGGGDLDADIEGSITLTAGYSTNIGNITLTAGYSTSTGNINLNTASTSIVLNQASQGITLTTGGASTIQIGPTNISSTYLLLTINSTPYKIALLT